MSDNENPWRCPDDLGELTGVLRVARYRQWLRALILVAVAMWSMGWLLSAADTQTLAILGTAGLLILAILLWTDRPES